jgi:hypothetical protein
MLVNLTTEFLFWRLVVYRGSINTNERAKRKKAEAEAEAEAGSLPKEENE